MLDVSLTGVALLRPVVAEGGTEVIDFRCTYLNPAAQELLGQPERPDMLHATAYLGTNQADTLAFCRDSFLSGQAEQQTVDYQYNGANVSLQQAARRSGELLVLSFADAAGQDADALAMALQEERTNQLNEELAATNEELAATNEEINASNLELITT